MVKILDNVLSNDTLVHMYDELIATQMWSINRQSTDKEKYFHNFPGHVVFGINGIINSNLFGFYNGVLEHIRYRCKEEYNSVLPPKLKRIHLGAKSSTSLTRLHRDTEDLGIVIVGFITPNWKSEWGGQLKIGDKEVIYKSGRFCVFNTNELHDGYPPDKQCPLWRMSVNILLTYN